MRDTLELKINEGALYRLRANGPNSLIVDFTKNKDHLLMIHQLTTYLLAQPPKDLINLIPASLSLTLVFNEPVLPDTRWKNYFLQVIEDCQTALITSHKHDIPVCYDRQLAQDFDSVCEVLQCNSSQLIEAHSTVNYRVDMLGFLPGFAYLSGLPNILQLPRKSKPALRIPAGSVAIAEHYSAIYPVDSPAGWHVIGRTSFPCINWNHEDFCPFKPLDEVRFVPISLEQFKSQEKSTW